MNKRKKAEIFFNKKIEPQYPVIYRHLINLGCEEEVALDLAQETMKTAWENIYDLIDMTYPVNWLYTVAQNKYYSYARLLFHKYEYASTDYIISEAEDEQNTKDIADFIASHESIELVDKALSLLDSKYSDLLRMRYFGDYTYHEMSEILGLNESTIRSAVRRGKHKMAKILTDLGYEEEDI